MKKKTDQTESRRWKKACHSQLFKVPRDRRFIALFQKATAGDENSIADLWHQYQFRFGEDEA